MDRLLTNFHLPKSTLLLLVSAFAGRDLILRAYEEAVREKYRFYSYGDCMLIFKTLDPVGSNRGIRRYGLTVGATRRVAPTKDG